MTTLRQWQAEIAEGGNHSSLTAIALLKAERAAKKAYESRVREMTYSGRGVTVHDGNNQKTVVVVSLQMLAHGWTDMFQKTVREYSQKASKDPVRYSPVSYALQTVAGSLAHG